METRRAERRGGFFCGWGIQVIISATQTLDLKIDFIKGWFTKFENITL